MKQKITIKRHTLGQNVLCSIFFLLITSCDFTSAVNKEILYAQELAEKRQYEEAVSVYEKVLGSTIKPHVKARIYFHLSEIYTSFLPDVDKAINYYEKILDIDVEPIWHVKSIEKIAHIHHEFKKDYEKATQYYTKLVSYYPPLENYHNYMEHILECLTELRSTKRLYDFIESHNLQKNTKLFHKIDWYLGLSYFYNKKWQEAINKWRSYLKHETSQDRVVRTKYLMANAYEMLEMLREAYNVYYSILNIYPNKEVIESRLQSLYDRRAARKR